MHRYLAALSVAILVVCASATTSFASNAPTDKVLLSESFAQFDQNLDTGWRTVAFQIRYQDAISLIRQYEKTHATTLSQTQQGLLNYHLGVVYALANEPDKAVHAFKQGLTSRAFGNPAYIEAHIAFAEKDKGKLLQVRHIIATSNPGPWRKGSLDEVNVMIQYFGQPFEAAFGALNCVEHAPANSSMWHSFCKTMMDKYGALYRAHQKSELKSSAQTQAGMARSSDR